MSGVERAGSRGVSVRFPRAWREAPLEERPFSAVHGTVGELLHDYADGIPAVAVRLFAPTGGIRRGIAVFLNDVDIRNLQGEATAVSPGDRVSVVPALPGG